MANELSRLKPPAGGGAKEKKRVGRGQSSGQGKTAGRGNKGQKGRTGNMNFGGFEGGQMPLQRRIPKRGFSNPFRVEYAVVNVADLEFAVGEKIGPAELLAQNFYKAQKDGLKILGDGELTKKLAVTAHKFSAAAKEKIEKAGGTCEVIELVHKPTPQERKKDEKATAKAAAKK